MKKNEGFNKSISDLENCNFWLCGTRWFFKWFFLWIATKTYNALFGNFIVRQTFQNLLQHTIGQIEKIHCWCTFLHHQNWCCCCWRQQSERCCFILCPKCVHNLALMCAFQRNRNSSIACCCFYGNWQFDEYSTNAVTTTARIKEEEENEVVAVIVANGEEEKDMCSQLHVAVPNKFMAIHTNCSG